MSKESQEIFACSINSCYMTFTNKDHLEWHKKKHDIMLNLELINKNNESADQTPTPTRFIRNCEEVGLFQDLQHVNPFEETFKKAVDSTKNGGNLEVPEVSNSNDTLHTPHILPHIQENQKQNINQIPSHSHSYEFTTNESTTIIASVHPAKNDVNIVKKKISENIQKNQSRNREENFISCVPFEDLTGKKNECIINLDSEEENESISFEKKKQIREMNRAAQLRCRKRKQLLWKQMEEEIHNLREENKKLKIENCHMKRQIREYLEKSCRTEETTEVVTTINSRKTQDDASHNNQKSLASIMTKSTPSTIHTIISIPIKLNQPINGGTCQSSVEDKHITNEPGSIVKRKIFRKIVPKIIINK